MREGRKAELATELRDALPSKATAYLCRLSSKNLDDRCGASEASVCNSQTRLVTLVHLEQLAPPPDGLAAQVSLRIWGPSRASRVPKNFFMLFCVSGKDVWFRGVVLKVTSAAYRVEFEDGERKTVPFRATEDSGKWLWV